MRNSRENPERGAGGRFVAVAVDKDRGSQHALKWAIENVAGKQDNLLLIHVKHTSSATPMPENDEVLIRRELDQQSRELFLPFRCLCTLRHVQHEIVLLEDLDVAKALIEFVSSYGIEILLLGETSRNTFAKIFKGTDIPSLVTKWAPEFCCVYVVSKRKITSVRASSRRAPSLSIADKALFTARSMDDDTNPIQATDNNRPDELPSPHAEQPLISAGSSVSTESTFLYFYDKLGPRPRLNGQPLEGLNMENNNIHPSNAEDAGKVKKPCRGAMDEAKRLKEAPLCWEGTLVVLEKEKAKCKAAIEAAEVAKKIATLEARRRVEAEKKTGKEIEERKKAVKALSRSNALLRYLTVFHIVTVSFLIYFNILEVNPLISK